MVKKTKKDPESPFARRGQWTVKGTKRDSKTPLITLDRHVTKKGAEEMKRQYSIWGWIVSIFKGEAD